jgi:type II secretory pathway component PulK
MIPLRTSTEFSRRGAALLLAMWALFVLSGAVLVWASYIRQTIAVSGENYNDTEARAMAHSGIALAMHPLVNKETPALMMDSENDPGFRVRIVSEGAKLNVNFLLAGEDPRKLDLFKRWLESRGIEFQDRERMVDCMLDWLDADNVKRLNGQEDTAGYHPPNRGQFLSVEDLAEVAGTEPLTSQAGWKNDLTVYSQGPIDLASADSAVLRLLPGVGDAAIESFLQWRRGGDGLDGTLDDPQIQKLEQVQGFLGLNKTQWNALGGMIMLHDNTSQIISEGWSGKVVRQVSVVVHKGGQNPQFLSWKE